MHGKLQAQLVQPHARTRALAILATSSTHPPGRTSRWSGRTCPPTPDPAGNMLLGGSRNAIEMIRCPSQPFAVRGRTAPRPSASCRSFKAIIVSRIRFRIDALLDQGISLPALPRHLRVDRQHAERPWSSSLVGAGSSEVRLPSPRRHQNGTGAMHHHVAVGAGLLIERRPFAQCQRLRDVDLHMVDEVSDSRSSVTVVAKRNARMFCTALAQEMIDAEDAVLVEHLVQPGVQRLRAPGRFERLFHDDP